ncbi:carbamoyltransferase HypF [Vibrio sp. HN007]|uniref:carbamoyltransferase HypF n=1 Tax=Vibrio iocasae TaxID=3098914 RepID=UPI0035D415AA
MNGVELRVKGKVQGVGFRPFVWQLAHELALCGEVLNDGEGVLIRFVNSDNLHTFQTKLVNELPPLAQIDSVHSQDFEWDTVPSNFSIAKSEATAMDTQVVPDAASCPECIQELHDNKDKRYQYPFINCTHCGPRFTIINELPYDRPKTVMKDFPLCPDCLSEYENPGDRRYHAQPVACDDCGPEVWVCNSSGDKLEGNWLSHVISALTDGNIIAIKSVGGFHLACDATNQTSIQLLRDRKHRQYKPFAIMVNELSSINEIAYFNEQEQELLESRIAPITLLSKKGNNYIAENIAPELNEIGVMLPSNPVQHLIADAFKKPLVMTSGNATGLPPALSNEEAIRNLASVVDIFVLHNREIVQRCDDSLVRVNKDSYETLRRSRGFVPDAVNLPEGFPNADGYLAYGGDLKNAFAIGKGNQIIVSQYLGDLSNIETQTQYKEAINHFESLYQVNIDNHVFDKHPGYFSHQYAKSRKGSHIEIQHHHAHIASCLLENGWQPEQGKVMALALDGLGYGDDGELWGAELMIADYSECQRIGGIPSIDLVGGDFAAKQPWRSLHAHLHKFCNLSKEEMNRLFPNKPLDLIEKAVAQNLNCHPTRSAGRLFDAVAASLGIGFDGIEYEGQAACQLEALASKNTESSFAVEIPTKGLELDISSFWNSWLNNRSETSAKAWGFHHAMAKALAEISIKAKEQNQLEHLVVTGGVFHNKLLNTLLEEHLGGQVSILKHQQFSCGDGGLALGQLAIALNQNNYPKQGNS